MAKFTTKQSFLLLAKLLMDGVPDTAAKFYVRLYPLFLDFTEPVSAAEVALLMQTTPETTLRHFKVLERYKFMERAHYRGWTISADRLEQHNKMLSEA